MRILVKYASRQRPVLFRKAIENIYATISKQQPFQILVTLDRDDTLMMKEQLPIREEIGYLIGDCKSKIEAINYGVSFANDWDILVNMSDDMRFLEKDWDLRIADRYLSVGPDCFLHFNDGFVGKSLATMSIFDRKYYERDGYVYHPGYKSFSCDAEAYYVARARSRWFYFDEVLFHHEHPANMRVPNDDLYRKNSLATAHDEKLYWERLHNNFDLEKEGLTGPWPWDWEKKK